MSMSFSVLSSLFLFSCVLVGHCMCGAAMLFVCPLLVRNVWDEFANRDELNITLAVTIRTRRKRKREMEKRESRWEGGKELIVTLAALIRARKYK